MSLSSFLLGLGLEICLGSIEIPLRATGVMATHEIYLQFKTIEVKNFDRYSRSLLRADGFYPPCCMNSYGSQVRFQIFQ